MVWASPLPRAAILTLACLLFAVVSLFAVTLFDPILAERGLANFCQWDCGWYRHIAAVGYSLEPKPDTLQLDSGFFPGFPLAVRLVQFTGLDFVTASLALNAIYALLFAWLAFTARDALLLSNDQDATIFVAAFFLSPWGLYNHVPYTEMQFNLAALATFIAWRRGHFVTAAICGVILSATRITGVFLPVLLLIEMLVLERWHILKLLQSPDARFRALAVMPLGGIAFFAYLGFLIGDPLAYFHAQQIGWEHGLRNPLETLIGGVQSGTFRGLVGATAFVAGSGLLITGWLNGRVPMPLVGFTIVVGFTSLLSGLYGLPRYMLATFPIYLLIPALPRRLAWVLIAVLAVLQVGMTYLWVRHSVELL